MRRAGARLALAAVLGLAAVPVGVWRLHESSERALPLSQGERVHAAGIVGMVPRRFDAGVLFTVETAGGVVAVRSRSAAVAAGDRVRVSGHVAPTGDWITGYLRRLGARSWIEAQRVRAEGPGRGGVEGALDSIRNRAMAAIDDSMPAAQAALVRGFVLGDDSRIPTATAEQFKRSGLAHLLAVSGQNVILLLALVGALLIALGVPLRWRWPALALAVILYVPVAGAGPSIQRAGVMGLAGIAAAAAQRPADRWWALFLAALVTIAWNPLSVTDAGWQLSFAAVAGIALGARPLADAVREIVGARQRSVGLRAGLAEGVAMTACATLATAPLMALHFDAVSLAALPANVMALPAVAPVMWSGMALALAAQISWLPVAPLGWLAARLAGYVEWVAELLSEPGWASMEIPLGSGAGLLAAYALLASAAVCSRGLARRLRGLIGVSGQRGRAIALVLAAALLAASAAAGGPGAAAPQKDWRFELRFLDVGQGDAVLARERGGPAALIDTGYAGTGAEQRLSELGVERLAALVLTHADSDHAGALEAVAATLPIGVVVTNGRDRRLSARIRGLGLRHRIVAAGERLRLGGARLDVIWPPSGQAGGEANAASIVTTVRWRRFSALLTGDAEAEAAAYAPADVDVLKVPHHGSADSGLGGLLVRSSPELAVVSVGSENSYGHPAAATLSAISASSTPLLRTDEDGEVAVAVGRRAWSASTG